MKNLLFLVLLFFCCQGCNLDSLDGYKDVYTIYWMDPATGVGSYEQRVYFDFGDAYVATKIEPVRCGVVVDVYKRLLGFKPHACQSENGLVVARRMNIYHL